MTNLKNKRNRPRVPLSSRKRAIQACTPCRLRKSKCRFTSRDACQSCRSNDLRCFFEPVKREDIEDEDDTTMLSDDTENTLIYHVLRNFNKDFPSAGLKKHHVASLLRLLAKSDQHTTAASKDSVTLGQIGLTHTEKSCGLPDEGFWALAAKVVSQAKTDNRQNGAHLVISPLFHNIHIDHNHIILPSVLIGQANYYYLHEKSFRSRISALYLKKPSWPGDLQFIGLALITFAVASQYAHVDDDLSSDKSSIPGEVYFKCLQRLLPQILAELSLESIQICLLMAAYLLPIYGSGPSYTYIDLAMRMAIAQGLHQADTNSKFPVAVRELYNRVFWTTYIHERCIAGDLGYPGVIQIAEVKCPSPRRMLDLDGPETSQIDRLIVCKDLLLLSDQVVQSRKTGHDSVEFRTACSRLRCWKRTLRPEFQTLNTWRLRTNAHLQIHYHLCWTYFGRVDLIHMVQAYLNGQRRDSDIVKENDSDAPSITLSASCVDSAYEILDLIRILYQQQQIERFSHTDFHSCLVATTIILLDSVIHPSSKAAFKIATAMEALRYMATWNPNAQNGLRYIEGLLKETNRVLFYLHRQEALYKIPGNAPLDVCNSTESQAGEDARYQWHTPVATCYDLDLSHDVLSEYNIRLSEIDFETDDSTFSALQLVPDEWSPDHSYHGTCG